MSKELVETRSAIPAPRRQPFMQDFDRLFDRISTMVKLPAMERLFERAIGPNVFAPTIDIAETTDEYKVTAEVPGLEPSQVAVSVAGDTLVIKGAKTRETEKTEGVRPDLRTDLRLVLAQHPAPRGVDAGQIEVNHRNGVLTIRLPKTREAEAKRRRSQNCHMTSGGRRVRPKKFLRARRSASAATAA